MWQERLISCFGNHLQTSIINSRICDRYPNRHHFGLICLRMGNPSVLMPVCAGDMGPHLILIQQRRRRLQAHMLNRVRGELRTKQAFHIIQQPRISQHGEHSRPEMHRGLRCDSIPRQGNIQRLKPVTTCLISQFQLGVKICICRQAVHPPFTDPI